MVMALATSFLSSSLSPPPKPKSNLPHPLSPIPIPIPSPSSLLLRLSTKPLSIPAITFSLNQIIPTPQHERPPQTHIPPTLLGLAASLVFFLGSSVRACSAASSPLSPVVHHQDQMIQDENKDVEDIEDEEIKAAFENWKSKTYALTVPLRIVSLQGSLPQSWVKDFMKAQGKRLKLQANFCGSLEDIFNNLSMPFSKVKVKSKSFMAADIVGIGDSWLSFAIKKVLIEPIPGLEEQDWFRSLSDKWKVYLRRNYAGEIDPEGKIWAAPYRWGSMVIAYKKSKFQKHKLAPIEDWTDLWRPELAGRISMVNSPREVIGAVLKYMGASYNTSNMNLQLAGGRTAVQQNLSLLGKQVHGNDILSHCMLCLPDSKNLPTLRMKGILPNCNLSSVLQVRLFDSMHYLKAFGVGDVWVAVGWSSDILPAAKRMSNVTVIVPKSGASLWADLWAIPAASRLETDQIGGRVRGPSPLIHQWIEFCLQAARALPFKQEVIPGASPSALESTPVEMPRDLLKGKPKLDTNLIAGVPPPEILARCEFLEPLSDDTLSDYEWLINGMQKPSPALMNRIQQYLSSLIDNFQTKAALKSDVK
ncbi:hypothetical protein Patl1_02594 [Pistacia atlantica]|uniref:Uncharacterized protein n=1 Tax=Pistacia atlantica TaxID=434234 RepID=A0ACC1C5L6_9ROSI|nr:hypothetical protein Patl1_02594 [Pistacia atlantica]